MKLTVENGASGETNWTYIIILQGYREFLIPSKDDHIKFVVKVFETFCTRSAHGDYVFILIVIVHLR